MIFKTRSGISPGKIPDAPSSSQVTDQTHAVTEQGPRRWHAAEWLLPYQAGAHSSWSRFGREIAVVVLGVLIAFALDAWWTAREHRREAAAELRGIHAELAESARMLDGFLAHDSLAIAASSALITAATQHQGDGDLLVADTVFRWLLGTGTFEPPTGRIESLLASGNIALVEDLRLRERIAGWPSRVRDAREHQDRMRDFWMADLVPYLREQTAPAELWGESPTGWVQLPAAPPMLNLLHQYRFHAEIVARHNRGLRNELILLRQHVDSAVAHMPR